MKNQKPILKKNFFIIDIYNKIKFFKTLKKYFNYFENKNYYIGVIEDDVGNKEIIEDNLFPLTKHNKQIYKKQKYILKKIDKLWKKLEELPKQLKVK